MSGKYPFAVFIIAVLALAAATLPAALPADETGVVFVNKTPWPVHIVAGSGRVDVCDIAPFGQAETTKLPAREESCYPLFDVSLTETFSIKDLRPADRDFYYQIDGRRKNQRIEITAPDGFNDTRAFIIISNGSKSGGISLSRNDSLNRMTTEETKGTVNVGETAVYAVNPAQINAFTVHPQNVPSGCMAFQTGLCVSFFI